MSCGLAPILASIWLTVAFAKASIYINQRNGLQETSGEGINYPNFYKNVNFHEMLDFDKVIIEHCAFRNITKTENESGGGCVDIKKTGWKLSVTSTVFFGAENWNQGACVRT